MELRNVSEGDWSYSVAVSTADFESANLGSNPSKTYIFWNAFVAQLVERVTVNHNVVGSSPAESEK